MARVGLRITPTTIAVLKVFVDEPDIHHYGFEIMRKADIQSGSLYPILERLQTAGWLTSEWEPVDPAQAKRPRRRLYRITNDGLRSAHHIIAIHEISLRKPPERVPPPPIPDGQLEDLTPIFNMLKVRVFKEPHSPNDCIEQGIQDCPLHSGVLIRELPT